MRLNFKSSIIMIVIFVSVITSCSSPVENIASPVPTPIFSAPEIDFNQDSRARGKVVRLDHWNLSFSIPGQVVELFIEEGDVVKAGDLVAKLDSTSLITQVVQAEGELSLAQAKLARVMKGPHEAEITEAEIAITAIAARRPLNSAQSTAQVYELAAAEARLDYLSAQPFPEDVAVAQAEVEQALLNAEAAKARLKMAGLFAPTDGTVTKVFVNANEYAGAGQPIMEISDLTKLFVEVEMDDLEVASLEIGDSLIVTFEALPGIDIEGQVIRIKPSEASDSERSFVVLLDMEEIPKGLRWGMTAEVVIPQ